MLIPLCDEIRRSKLPAITFLMVVVHLSLFISALDGQWLSEGGRLHEICFNSGVSHTTYQHSQWLNYGTYWLLDKSWFALIANLFILIIFGPSLENRAGRLLFLLIYAGSGVVGGLFHSLMPSSVYPTVMTSGAIAGLLGAYAVQIDLQTKIRTVAIYYEHPISGISLCFLWIFGQVLLANHEVCESGAASFAVITGGFMTGVVFGFATKEFTPNVVVTKAGSLEVVSRREAALIKRTKSNKSQQCSDPTDPACVCPYCHTVNQSPLIDNEDSLYYQCNGHDCGRLVFISRKSATRLA